jgi:MFS family permease
VRVIALGFCAVVACNGVDDVALVFLARDTFHAGDAAVALLLAAAGIGLFAGYALLAAFPARVPMAVLLIAGFAVSSVGNLLTGLAWAVAAAFTVQTVRGLGIAAMDVASSTLLPRLVPPDMLGRVFGNLYGGIGVAAALSYVAGSVLLDRTSAPVTLVVAGGLGTLATAVTAVALRRHRHRLRAAPG